MKNILSLAAERVSKKSEADDTVVSMNADDDSREALETAVMEFENAKSASEKVDALRAFIELASAA